MTAVSIRMRKAALEKLAQEATYYIVKPGDTLSAIAKRHGSRTQDFVRANNLSNPDRLRIGQRLAVPKVQAAAKASTQAATPLVSAPTRPEDLLTPSARAVFEFYRDKLYPAYAAMKSTSDETDARFKKALEESGSWVSLSDLSNYGIVPQNVMVRPINPKTQGIGSFIPSNGGSPAVINLATNGLGQVQLATAGHEIGHPNAYAKRLAAGVFDGGSEDPRRAFFESYIPERLRVNGALPAGYGKKMTLDEYAGTMSGIERDAWNESPVATDTNLVSLAIKNYEDNSRGALLYRIADRVRDQIAQLNGGSIPTNLYSSASYPSPTNTQSLVDFFRQRSANDILKHTEGLARERAMDSVSRDLHAVFSNPKLEAAMLANIDRETGGTFRHNVWQGFRNEPFKIDQRQTGGYGLFQYTGSTLANYKKWLTEKGINDSQRAQIDFMKEVYGPSRSGWRANTSPTSAHSSEQLADWLHRRVETPAHVIPSNPGYSKARIQEATNRHNSFMKNSIKMQDGRWVPNNASQQGAERDTVNGGTR